MSNLKKLLFIFFILSSSFIFFSCMLFKKPQAVDGAYILVINQGTDTAVKQDTGVVYNREADGIYEPAQTFRNSENKSIYPIDRIIGTDMLLTNRMPILSSKGEPPKLNDIKDFITENYETGKKDTVQARLLSMTAHCYVWVEVSYPAKITSGQTDKLAEEFEKNIYPLIYTHFVDKTDLESIGAVYLLCYDIKDGFSGSGGFVAGYFSPADLSNDSTSNKCPLLYIDTYPLMTDRFGVYKIENAFSTVTHELQHLSNFYVNSIYVNYIKEEPAMQSLWMDEGLSMAAEDLYNGTQTSRITYYNGSDNIRNGKVPLIQNRPDLFWLDNYSLSYLFFQYLYSQTSDSTLYKKIIYSPYNDFKALEEACGKSISELMTDFRIALFLNKPSGKYGFNSKEGFDGIAALTSYNYERYLEASAGFVIKAPADRSFELPEKYGPDIRFYGINP